MSLIFGRFTGGWEIEGDFRLANLDGGAFALVLSSWSNTTTTFGELSLEMTSEGVPCLCSSDRWSNGKRLGSHKS
jgi:hypothetical protein